MMDAHEQAERIVKDLLHADRSYDDEAAWYRYDLLVAALTTAFDVARNHGAWHTKEEYETCATCRLRAELVRLHEAPDMEE